MIFSNMRGFGVLGIHSTDRHGGIDIINILMGFYDEYEGEIIIDGNKYGYILKI